MRYLGIPIAGIVAAAGLALTAGCDHAAASSNTATTPPNNADANNPPPPAAAPPPAAPMATAPAAPPPAPAPMADATPATSPEQDAAAEEVRDHHRHHHHGGVTMFIAMSIDTLGVPPEKEAKLQAIQTTLHEKMAPAREAERKLINAIADGILKGKVDNGRTETAIENVAIANGGVHAASIDALNQLHAILSPEERGALVDKVRAHYAVWRKVNSDEAYGSHEKGSHLARLTAELNLTPAQVDQLSAALKTNAPAKPDAAEVEAHLDAFATAFASDKFDAKSMAKANLANAHIARHGAKRMVHFYSTVASVLTPEQRTLLAGHLKERLEDSHAVSNNP